MDSLAVCRGRHVSTSGRSLRGSIAAFAVLLLTFPLVYEAAAGSLPITLVRLTSPITAGSDARIEVVTAPGADCAIVVRYKSGPSKAKGLYPQTADTTGGVVWRWRVGSNTTPGRWPVIVSCTKGADRGELTAMIATQ